MKIENKSIKIQKFDAQYFLFAWIEYVLEKKMKKVKGIIKNNWIMNVCPIIYVFD